MNKKLLWALALPVVFTGCSQEDLVSEGITNTPQANAISGLTFTIAKNGTGMDSRAEWVGNKISFEKGDKVSLFWLGEDGYTQDNINGTFTGSVTELTSATAVTGKSNAVFRTEDGSAFAAEAVVYEGYNLLVYPGNTQHVESQNVVISLPQEQKAEEDFTKNVVYIGDSILHIHQPALKEADGKYYNLYGEVATTEDPNTSGYAHGIKTGVKLLSSLLNLEFRIINTSAKDVKIEKVELTTEGGTQAIYSIKGNLVPEGTTGLGFSANAYGYGNKTKYRNPWYQTVAADGNVTSVTLNCENIETDMAGTKVTMLLLPTNIDVDTPNWATDSKQPVMKIYTNYGVVTIGGDAAASTQSNCIYKANGYDYAATSDNVALQEIILNATGYKDEMEVPSTNNQKATYTFNSGVSMTRVINVDMQKADIQDQHAASTEELNAILNAAVASNKTYDSTTPLTVYIDFDEKKNFELTSYAGLDAFAKKFGEDALKLCKGKNGDNETTPYNNIIVNTTEDTELKNIPVLKADGSAAGTLTITIPATSKISTIKNGTNDARYTIGTWIINEKEITVPAYASITLSNNTKGTIHYTSGAAIDVTRLTSDTYGIIDYTADTADNLTKALEAGVNYVTLKNITSGFFAGGIDANGSSLPTYNNGGVTIVFDNCGKLNETISSGSNTIKAATIILKNGTSYPDLKNATVSKIVVESETAELGSSNATAQAMTNVTIEVAAGTTTIDNLDLKDGTVEVAAGATATIGKKAKAPVNFYVFGTATFAGSNNQTSEKVYTLSDDKISGIAAINGNCVVTGSLALENDLAYKNVAVSETTKITVAEGVKGLGYTDKIYVTKDEQAKGTENLKYVETSAYTASKLSWNGNVEDIN